MPHRFPPLAPQEPFLSRAASVPRPALPWAELGLFTLLGLLLVAG